MKSRLICTILYVLAVGLIVIDLCLQFFKNPRAFFWKYLIKQIYRLINLMPSRLRKTHPELIWLSINNCKSCDSLLMLIKFLNKNVHNSNQISSSSFSCFKFQSADISRHHPPKPHTPHYPNYQEAPSTWMEIEIFFCVIDCKSFFINSHTKLKALDQWFSISFFDLKLILDEIYDSIEWKRWHVQRDFIA